MFVLDVALIKQRHRPYFISPPFLLRPLVLAIASLSSPLNYAAAQTIILDPVRVEGHAEPDFGEPPTEPGGLKADYQSTATKMALPLRETPQAMSVLTSSALESRQVQGLQNALELTPGSQSGGNPNPGRFAGEGNRQFGLKFVLRGQETSGERDVRSDGFSVGSLNAIDTAAYERIEVLRGASGFYGQGSLGGFINLVRKKPEQAFAATAALELGAHNTYRSEFDINGALTQEADILGRVVAAYEDAGSFVDGVENQRLMVAPSLEVRVGENSRILAQALYQDEDFIPNSGVPALLAGDRIKPLDIPRSQFIGMPSEEPSTANTTETRIRLDHRLSDQWLSSLLLQHSSAERRADYENYGYSFGDASTVYLYHGRYFVDEDRWAGELRLEGEFSLLGQTHRLLLGAEQNQRKVHRRNGFTYLGTGDIESDNFNVPANEAFSWRVDRRSTIDSSALYGQLMFSFTEKTQLLVSARADRAEQNLKGLFLGEPENPVVKTSDASTLRIGLSHALNRHISAYAAYGESFNPLVEESRQGILDPETGEGYDIGLKSEWFDQRLSANLSYYQQQLSNRPIVDPNNSVNEFYFINSGIHEADGLELEITGSPMPGLSLALAASWMDNEFVDPLDIDTVGLKSDGSVDRQHSVYAHYEFQQGLLKGLGLGATLVNSDDRHYLQGGRQIFADGYERIDLHASYNQLERWELSLLVRNIKDAKYLEATSAAYGTGNYFTAPRSALLSARYYFD